jgi:hypothetical protein
MTTLQKSCKKVVFETRETKYLLEKAFINLIFRQIFFGKSFCKLKERILLISLKQVQILKEEV